VRSIDSLQARLLPGTDRTVTFFWSPDSRYLVLQSAGGKLKKIDVLGGPPQTLCDGAGALLGGSWNTDRVIVFGGTGPTLRVSAAGGATSTVTKVENGRDEVNHTGTSCI
jgi:hypothetical protein